MVEVTVLPLHKGVRPFGPASQRALPCLAAPPSAEPGQQPRLSQCYKSSKDHSSPQLDVSLLGSSVVHKEKQVRKKEHKLKITPLNADVIVLGLQSRTRRSSGSG